MNTAGTCRVILVDDHPLFREGLKSVIAAGSGFEVTAEAGGGEECLQVLAGNEADLVITDISMPGMDGTALVAEVKKRWPGTGVMVVSMYTDMNHITASFRAGADAYLAKESAAERLLEGMRRVAAGEKYIDPTLSSVLVEEFARGGRDAAGGYDLLTRREQQIMRLLAEGIDVSEIAARCFISPKTVENHRTSIMKKLGLKKEAQLVRYAARIGLIDMDLWR